MTDLSQDELLAEGFKRARIYAVDPRCAQVYAEGWAAAAKLAMEHASLPLRTVQVYGYGYEWRDPRDGSTHLLDPKDVVVILPSTRHLDDFDLHNSLHLAEEKLAVLERRIARVRQMCDLMVRVKDAQAILEVLDGMEDGKPPGERCNQLYDHPELGLLRCLWRRRHVGEHENGNVTWSTVGIVYERSAAGAGVSSTAATPARTPADGPADA